MAFAAMTPLAEGLSYRTVQAESRKFSYLRFRHTNTKRVHDGMAIYFALMSSGINCSKNLNSSKLNYNYT
jgi:hypothetical protein